MILIIAKYFCYINDNSYLCRNYTKKMKKSMIPMINRLLPKTMDFGRSKGFFATLLLVAMSVTTAKAQSELESTDNRLLHENMLQAVKKVLIIDSVVVPKKNFVSHIPLSSELGKLEETEGGFQYTNEFGDRMLVGVGDDVMSAIYTKSKEGDQWGNPQQIPGFGRMANYPFLMPDGVTLYFARKGEGSIGGYDIFVTRYDIDDKEYLKPQNIGFPFNSEANDYLYIEDEQNSLGWFVTDRRQPEGMVCIYTFVPSSRGTYNVDVDGLATVKARAAVTSIKDTWSGNLAEKEKAELRLKNLSEQQTTSNKQQFSFVINDDITYNSIDQFRAPGNKQNVEQLQTMKQSLEKKENDLDDARDKFHAASEYQRNSMKENLVKEEKEMMQLRRDINGLTKRIRNEEIRYLTGAN